MRTMRDTKIPVLIDPKKAARQGISLDGVVPSKHLKRLLESSCGACSDVKAEITFGVDVQGLPYIKGTATAEVSLLCQRCMKPYHQGLKAEFCYSPVDETENLEALPEIYDVIETDEQESIHLHHLIEDELMLAIPLIPSHSNDDCFSGNHDVTIGDIPNVEETRKNPFAALASLKKRN